MVNPWNINYKMRDGVHNFRILQTPSILRRNLLAINITDWFK